MKVLSRRELRAALVKRRPDDHKGVFGHVLVVAGSRGMAGAAILCARAALRSGAGLVTLAAPASLQSVVAPQAPEAMTLGLPENAAGALRPEGVDRLKAAHKDRGYTVLALGPGLSEHHDTARFVLLALSGLPVPAVVDADALNLLAAQEALGVRELMAGRAHPCVFTPHPGEMARCLGLETSEVLKDRATSAESLARQWRGVAVLKGHRTLIAGSGKLAVNPTGGPGLAKGGSGDVLTGLIAGLWAQMIASGRISKRRRPGGGPAEGGAGRLGADAAFQAAALGAWLHGTAGEIAQEASTPWAMTASDVIASLPAAFRRL